MHILVTGGAGYIGTELVAQLLERGDRVTVVDRLYFGDEGLASFRDRMTLIQGDVREFDPHWLTGVDAVSHLAGLSNDPTAEYNPQANWQMNVVATQRIVHACKQAGISRLVFGSSASVYDGLGAGMFDERTQIRPRGAYATSKKAAEDYLLAEADDSFSPVILRQGTVYGFSRRMRFDLVVNTFVKDALLYGKLFLHGGGWQWRPLVDVTDVARAHAIALAAPGEDVHAQIFNVMQENYQVRQLAMLVAGTLSLVGRSIVLEEAPLPTLVRDYRTSNLKLTQALDFTPAVTALESLDTMLKRLPLERYADFQHPRYYNIAWMSLLEAVHQSQSQYATIY